jgi:predicted RNA-binding Zn ribbon-like protein
MVEAGLLASPPEVSSRQLAAGRALREAINRLARPGVEPKPADHGDVNRWAARAPLAPQLTNQRTLVSVADRRLEASFATIACDAVDLLSGPLAGSIRDCGAPDCALFFVDTTRPGTRRWCSTAACCNRVRTKAYRQRRKEVG